MCLSSYRRLRRPRLHATSSFDGLFSLVLGGFVTFDVLAMSDALFVRC